jgi:guanosine-3',5'-bis(diphosphate) 3'-pyrophosphohydrolase
MKEWIAVLKAADVAACWHANQRRKGAAQEPYVNHLLEVATLVAEATGGDDPQLVIAALLHDAVEDCETPRELIEELFGKDVATLVLEVTDDKKLDKAERKRLQIENAPHKSLRARTLKLADKISNVRALATSPATDWSIGRKIEYLKWSRAVVERLKGTNGCLEEKFDEATAEAERSLRIPRFSPVGPFSEQWQLLPKQGSSPIAKLV